MLISAIFNTLDVSTQEQKVITDCIRYYKNGTYKEATINIVSSLYKKSHWNMTEEILSRRLHQFFKNRLLLDEESSSLRTKECTKLFMKYLTSKDLSEANNHTSEMDDRAELVLRDNPNLMKYTELQKKLHTILIKRELEKIEKIVVVLSLKHLGVHFKDTSKIDECVACLNKFREFTQEELDEVVKLKCKMILFHKDFLHR